MIEIARHHLTRIVVAIDPAVTSGEDSDETGIVIAGRGPHQPSTCRLGDLCQGHGYVLADLSCRVAPREWAKVAVAAFHDWQADRIVAEVNNGGDMVGETIRAVDVGVPYRQVRATRGKLLRAEPASALYDQGRVHHLGVFSELEDQQTTWTPDANWSPDRLDALVWALTELGLIGDQGAAFIAAWKTEISQRASAGPPELAHLPKHLAADDPVPLARGCQHRWREEPNGLTYCVICGGHRIAEAADTLAQPPQSRS